MAGGQLARRDAIEQHRDVALPVLLGAAQGVLWASIPTASMHTSGPRPPERSFSSAVTSVFV